MKIIQAHKFYWERDGASNYFLYLSKLLKKKGHQIVPFSMKHQNNLATTFDKYFVSNVDPYNPHKDNIIHKIHMAGRALYSLEAKKNIKMLLDIEKPSLVHLHNIYHHISPSILPEIKKRKIPVVMTLHDYKLLTPNYSFFHHGAVHEEDARGLHLSCVKNKCFKNSYIQSAFIVLEMNFHHKIMKYYEKFVDKFIAPSEFIKNKFIEFGWPAEKFVQIPNPIDLKQYKLVNSDNGYVVFHGRLSEEKGARVVLSAAEEIRDIPIKIVGEGPLLKELKSIATRKKLKNVEFLGFKTGAELRKILAGARILLAPSISYENYPNVVLEGKATGKIVLGSKIGGIPELLPNFLLVEPGNFKDLALKIKYWFFKDRASLDDLGKELRDEVIKINDPETHVNKIITLYMDLLDKENKVKGLKK